MVNNNRKGNFCLRPSLQYEKPGTERQGHLPQPGLLLTASLVAVGGQLSSRQYNKDVSPLPSAQGPRSPVFYSWRM